MAGLFWHASRVQEAATQARAAAEHSAVAADAAQYNSGVLARDDPQWQVFLADFSRSEATHAARERDLARQLEALKAQVRQLEGRRGR